VFDLRMTARDPRVEHPSQQFKLAGPIEYCKEYCQWNLERALPFPDAALLGQNIAR